MSDSLRLDTLDRDSESMTEVFSITLRAERHVRPMMPICRGNLTRNKVSNLLPGFILFETQSTCQIEGETGRLGTAICRV